MLCCSAMAATILHEDHRPPPSVLYALPNGIHPSRCLPLTHRRGLDAAQANEERLRPGEHNSCCRRRRAEARESLLEVTLRSAMGTSEAASTCLTHTEATGGPPTEVQQQHVPLTDPAAAPDPAPVSSSVAN